MSYLAPIIVLGLVILVHELGHFWAAKVFGVYAPRFSIGFGPALWRRRWGETEFVLAAIPLGGYVRMATRDDEATTALEGKVDESKGGQADFDPEAMIPFGPKPVPRERWFESKPLWQRAIILLAGVTMNVVLAVVVTIGVIGIYGRPYLRPVVDTVVDTLPAGLAGIQPGDSLASVDGIPLRTWTEFVNAVSAKPGEEITLGVVRGGAPLEVRLTPRAATDTNILTGEPVTVGRVGIGAPPDPRREPVPIGDAVVQGTTATWNMGVMVVQVLGGLVTGQIAVTQLGGPVAIARTSVAAARTGLENMFALIAFLSVNLAILNLVPIPLLDGGQLVMQTAETIKGSPFSDRAREWYARVGLAAIAALFLVVTFNDLKALLLSWIG